MGRPKSGKTAPRGRMSLIDRFAGGNYVPPEPKPLVTPTPTGTTVSAGQQMRPVVAPAKINKTSTPAKAVAAKPVAKPAPKKAPAKQKPTTARPVPQPDKPRTKNELQPILGGNPMVRTDPELAAKAEAKKKAEADAERAERARLRAKALEED